jgi:hypothetical protein
MPTFRIASSLYEPVTIELEDGRKFVSAPLSPFLIQEITKLQEQMKAGTLDGRAAIIQQVALVYSIDVKEVERMDVRILEAMMENASRAITSGRGGGAVPEIEVEKNAQKPGGEISH